MSIVFQELYKRHQAISTHEHLPYVLALINDKVNTTKTF